MVVAAPAGFAPPALAHRESNKEKLAPGGREARTTRGGLRSRAVTPLNRPPPRTIRSSKLRAEEENCAALPAAERQARLEKAYKQATKAGLASADAAPVWLKLATRHRRRRRGGGAQDFQAHEEAADRRDGADSLRWAAFEGKQGEREKERDILESAQALGDAIDQRAPSRRRSSRRRRATSRSTR